MVVIAGKVNAHVAASVIVPVHVKVCWQESDDVNVTVTLAKLANAVGVRAAVNGKASKVVPTRYVPKL
jgi:hypothetical protein